MRAAIIDDEINSILVLKDLLASLEHEIEIVGTASSVEGGLDLIRNSNIQVLFLDVELGSSSGFDLLDQLGEVDFEIVFITAFNQYAIKAFRYAALDYLLKPIDLEFLAKTISRLNHNKTTNARVNVLMENHKSPGEFKRLTLSTSEGTFFYDLETITHCQADGAYTTIFSCNQKPLMVSKSIKEYENILPSNFFRVHKSYLLNLHFVVKMELGEKSSVSLKDGTEIAVSRRRKQALSERLKSL